MAGDQKYLENLEEAHRWSECREFSAAKNVQNCTNYTKQLLVTRIITVYRHNL
jgi:hypothetical protein